MGEKRDRQREDRRNQILSISLDMFIQKGYYGTSTRAIASMAGISSGLIFNYFENKDAIYETLIEIGSEKMNVDKEMALKNPYLYMNNMITEIFQQLDRNEFYAKMFVFMDQAQHTVGISKHSQELLQKIDIIKQCGSIINYGQVIGQFREGDSESLTVAFLTAIQGIAQEKVRSNIILPKTEWIMDILTGGRKNEG